MGIRELRVRERVVYTKEKCGFHPGPRARDLRPAPHGDTYTYHVDKYWVVLERCDRERTVVLGTRRGKRHRVRLDDPALRRATWWERVRYARRFPSPADGELTGPVADAGS